MLLITLYASGLRVTEGSQLRIQDIDSSTDRMSIRVCAGKGGKDRYTLLSPSLLTLLRSYCRTHGLHHSSQNPDHWLFPNKQFNGPTAVENIQRAYQAARQYAGITKTGCTHTLRHCFATHLLESSGSSGQEEFGWHVIDDQHPVTQYRTMPYSVIDRIPRRWL